MIRDATLADLEQINAIYNHYVPTSTATYQTVPSTAGERREWFAKHGDRHPVLVYDLDGEVAGWGSLSPYHPRDAYRRTVEDSIYIRHERHRRGLGRALLGALIERARQVDHHTIVAVVSADQDASLALHSAFGFERAGTLREVGHKFGRWLDAAYLQLIL
jgi:L-amino acid N-acyltransferase